MSKFTNADLEAANTRFQMLSYYPPSPSAQAAVMELLAKMCPHKEALEWLVDTMLNRVGTWKGPMELRGVLCWKFKPADGEEVNSSLAGFTAEDGERVSAERNQDIAAIESAEARELLRSLSDRKRLM